MIAPTETVVGAVLAGGKSRRMGQAKAGLALPDGRRMSEVVMAALAPLSSGGLVGLGHGEGLPHGLARLPDLRPDAGPLAGVEALLASGLAEAYLIAPCDLPCLTTEALAPLLAALTSGTLAVVYADTQAPRGMQHLPMALRPAALFPLRELLNAGHRAVGHFLATCLARTIPLNPLHSSALRGANTPEELRAILGYCEG